MDLLEQVTQQREEILSLVQAHMEWDLEKALLWYKTENPHFGGATAEWMVSRSRGNKVLNFIKAMIDESKPG